MIREEGRNFPPLPPSGAKVFDFILLYSLPTPSLLDLRRRRNKLG